MKIHDISLAIRPGMPVWPGDPAFDRQLVWQMGAESVANVSRITLSVHTGTHVDAPIHFIPGGSGVEAIPLPALVGPCRVCQVRPSGNHIGAGDLEALALPAGTERILLKTRNSEIWERDEQQFEPEFVALAQDGARWIVERRIKLVGVDYLSVEPFGSQQPVVHRALLAAGVVPLEGVNLSGIEPGAYTLVCLPMKLWGSDGAPARAILIEE